MFPKYTVMNEGNMRAALVDGTIFATTAVGFGATPPEAPADLISKEKENKNEDK